MKGKKVVQPGFYSIDSGVSSHIGQRQQNQDTAIVTCGKVSLSGKGRLFAVADGMGGQPGGSIASRLACKGLNDYYQKELSEKGTLGSIEISRHLEEVILRIDRDLRRQGLRDRTLEDMGTTLSCLVVAGTHGIIVHVGDSRIYRLRNGHLTCLTVDHTFVQDMIFEGEVDPQKAHLHPLRHMLTRAVGTGEPLELVDTRIDELKKKDCFLICTDGLYNVLTAACILDLLSRRVSASETAQTLVNQARQNGARDNITAIVIKFE